MEPATFVVTALAGAVLKEVATDSYKAVKAKLVGVFGLGKAVEAVEEEPDDADARAFLAAKVAKSGALEDGGSSCGRSTRSRRRWRGCRPGPGSGRA